MVTETKQKIPTKLMKEVRRLESQCSRESLEPCISTIYQLADSVYIGVVSNGYAVVVYYDGQVYTHIGDYVAHIINTLLVSEPIATYETDELHVEEI